MAYINYLNYYISSNMEKSTKILKEYGFSDEEAKKFNKKTGLKNISIIKSKSEFDIYNELLSDFFILPEVETKDITNIMYINMLGFENKECLPYAIQKKYKMDKATVILLNEKCGATVQALELTDALIEKDASKKVLILSTVISEKDRFIDTTILGDAVGIMYISAKSRGMKISDTISFTDGQYSLDMYENKKFNLQVYNVILKGSSIINNILLKNNLKMYDIELIIPLNISYASMDLYSSLLKVNLNKFYMDNIPKGGHLGDVDTIRNLTDVIRNYNLQKGDKVIIYSLGYKLYDITYYAMLLEI
ncbi:hypothetical protein [Clostridium akagii]|uniref:hypothetical protein n=1 Tax=Clostridium akagii TaxID=91623 RepID=UPI00047CD8A3|nr:hypothetical protein [Clostridium akagii]